MLHWQMQEAKAKFSEVLRMARKEPQVITVRGKEEAVLISKERYDELTEKKKPSLVEFMRNSPLYGVDLDLERDKSTGREIDFSGPEYGP